MIPWVRKRSVGEDSWHGLQSCRERELQRWQLTLFRPSMYQALCWESLTYVAYVVWGSLAPSWSSTFDEWGCCSSQRRLTCTGTHSAGTARSHVACQGLALHTPSCCLCVKHQHNIHGNFPIKAVTKVLRKMTGKAIHGIVRRKSTEELLFYINSNAI